MKAVEIDVLNIDINTEEWIVLEYLFSKLCSLQSISIFCGELKQGSQENFFKLLTTIFLRPERLSSVHIHCESSLGGDKVIRSLKDIVLLKG